MAALNKWRGLVDRWRQLVTEQVANHLTERKRLRRKRSWRPARATYPLGPLRRRRLLINLVVGLFLTQLLWNWIPGAIRSVPEVVHALIPMTRGNWSSLSDSVQATVEGQFRLALVQSLAAAGAALALTYTARTYRLSYRGQVTERFSKALERLGSEEIYIRVGAVHALEQILYDAPGQAEPSAQVLASFVRHRSSLPTGGDIPENNQIPDDVQAALTTMTRINIRSSWPIDLSSLCLPKDQFQFADLSEVNIRDCDLWAARFFGARLIRADLTRAQCEEANFDQADLERAVMDGTDLHRTWFRHADLTGAFMAKAFLNWSHFEQARLAGAFLDGAVAHRVLFDGADLRGARLSGADLSGAWFRGARLDNADLRDANLGEADLYDAQGITVEQIVCARPTSSTHLPWSMKKDPLVVARINEVEGELRGSRGPRS
ncbi:pentapeptide repeat-containing protein [Streptomyces noursei]|uniref:pentapeptide repeat-containing protein n=1 Tax=Streptomyces noursei TaxID=1971 RepID=UPI0035DB9BA7